MYAIYTLTLFLICYLHVVSSKVIYDAEPSDAIRTQSKLLMAHTVSQREQYNSIKYSKLIPLSKIIRHGDRNLIYTCPTDPWKDPKYWPEGFGQLTNVSFLNTKCRQRIKKIKSTRFSRLANVRCSN